MTLREIEIAEPEPFRVGLAEELEYAKSLALSAGLAVDFVVRSIVTALIKSSPPTAYIPHFMRAELLESASAQQAAIPEPWCEKLKSGCRGKGRVLGFGRLNDVEYYGPLAGSPDFAAVNDIFSGTAVTGDWNEILYWKFWDFKSMCEKQVDHFGSLIWSKGRLALFPSEVELLKGLFDGTTLRYRVDAFPGFMINEFDGYGVRGGVLYRVVGIYRD